MLLANDVKSFNNLQFQLRNTIFGKRVFVANQSKGFKKREIYAALHELIEKDNNAKIQDCRNAIDKIIIIPLADKDNLFFINWIAFIIKSCKKIKNFFTQKPHSSTTSDIIKEGIGKLIESRENQILLKKEQNKTIKLREKLESIQKEKEELLKEKSIFELSQKSNKTEIQQLKEVSSRLEEIKQRNEILLKKNLFLKQKTDALENENQKIKAELNGLKLRNLNFDDEELFETKKENKSNWSFVSFLGGFRSPQNDPNHFDV